MSVYYNKSVVGICIELSEAAWYTCIHTCAYIYFPSLLQRVVSHYEAKEHTLYSKAREAEGVRRKQVQLVEKLQEDLEHLKQRNAMKLKVSGYSN